MDLSFPTFRRLTQGRLSLPFGWPWYTTAVQQRGLLRLIATGIEERLPLLPLLEAWTEDERGIQQRRLRKLLHLLSEGVPLADAVEQIPGILRDEDMLAVRFDAQSGTAATAVREVLNNPEGTSLAGSAQLRSTKLYLLTILLLSTPVIIFIEIRIVPDFRQIYAYYRLSLPWVTEAFVACIQLLENSAWLFILALLVGVLSFVFARPGRFIRQRVMRFVSPLRAKQTAGLLRMIGIASEAGRPLPSALSTLARYHFDPTLRNKLLFVRNEVEQGADLWQSMSSVDIISEADVRALDLSERLGNRSWVLAQLAAAKSRRAFRTLDYIAQLVLPVVVLLFGLFVLFQALALFAPLTNLIRGLAA